MLVCMDWGGRRGSTPISRLLQAQGRSRAEVRELPGPGPRQAVWIKIREVSFGP